MIKSFFLNIMNTAMSSPHFPTLRKNFILGKAVRPKQILDTSQKINGAFMVVFLIKNIFG